MVKIKLTDEELKIIESRLYSLIEKENNYNLDNFSDAECIKCLLVICGCLIHKFENDVVDNNLEIFENNICDSISMIFDETGGNYCIIDLEDIYELKFYKENDCCKRCFISVCEQIIERNKKYVENQ